MSENENCKFYWKKQYNLWMLLHLETEVLPKNFKNQHYEKKSKNTIPKQVHKTSSLLGKGSFVYKEFSIPKFLSCNSF